MNNLIAGLLGFITANVLARPQRSVRVHRIVRRQSNLECQFCGRQIPRRRKKSELGAYRMHLSYCPAIIPVKAAICDCVQKMAEDAIRDVQSEPVKKGSGNPPESSEIPEQESSPSKVD